MYMSTSDGRIWRPGEEPVVSTLTFTDYDDVSRPIRKAIVANPEICVSSLNDNPFTIHSSDFYNSYKWVTWGRSEEFSEEDIPEMDIKEYRNDRSLGNRYAVACHNDSDLSQERILKSISVMKSKLMMQCAPYKINKIECKMTPAVKNNIINAYRKISMYGKKTPFVACFDEYGRRLSDEIKIDTMHGMDIKIVDPVVYGRNYVVFETFLSERRKISYENPEDLPF